MGFEDYGEQKFLREHQKEFDREKLREKIRKGFIKGVAILISVGIPTGIAITASEMLSNPENEEPETEEIAKEPKKSFEVAKPEERKTAKAKKEEFSSGEGEPPEPEGSEFAQNLINEKYNEFNQTSDFKITFDINDENGEVRGMIEDIGSTYGNPDHIKFYEAIAAQESRLKWEHSDDGGEGYFQITNIPKEVQEEVDKIAKAGNLTEEQINILQGILTFEYYLDYVKDARAKAELEPNEQEEILLAFWSYNIGPGHLDFSQSFEENYNRFKGSHRDYAPEVLAFKEAIEKGYRQ